MEGDTLSDFIDDVCGESRLRVEDDLGDGFVRLRSSEAERRQAAQDIRSSEDVVIELLRNARDAGASRIFLATQKTGNERLLTVLDDGQGIPAAQHERIFEPRVTSKLDSAHMDKWGMHGRGMALYSISVNAEEARVLQSEPGLGTSLTVATDTESLAEKADQSTFPCEALGLPLSERSARRILDGAIAALDPLTERLAAESFPRQAHRPSERRRNSKNARSLRLAPEDIDALKRGIGRLMEPVAETYYLEAVGEAEVIVGQEAIRITVPIRTSL